MRRAIVALIGLFWLAACAGVPEGPPPEGARLTAVIDLSDQEVTVTRRAAGARAEVWRWPVSTGTAGHPTPKGTFRPASLSRDHRSSLYGGAPMPWSVFFNGHIAMHGTTEVQDLGRPASHGCVRLHPAQAEVFYRLVLEAGKANTVISVVD